MYSDYLRQFAQLRCAPGPDWSAATNFRAPHKPILLLSVIDLVSEGLIRTNLIELNDDLQHRFRLYWTLVAEDNRVADVAQPFFHLSREGFWYLVPRPGQEESVRILKGISSTDRL